MTIAEQLSADGTAIKCQLAELLGDDRALRDTSRDHPGFVIVGPTHVFGNLTLEQRRLQSKLLEDAARFFELAAVLLSCQPSSVLERLSSDRDVIRTVIAQDQAVWHRTTGEALAQASEAVEATLAAINDLYDGSGGKSILVPDTNALISLPAFDQWRAPDSAEIEIVLVPVVLAELDRLKIAHRNTDVRAKAQKVIRQLKELRRRGRLPDGVPVVRGESSVRSVATEPDFGNTLPWLDSSVADDRVLASVVEVVRAHPRSVVELVTEDINLQNKADFARLPSRDVGEILVRAKTR